MKDDYPQMKSTNKQQKALSEDQQTIQDITDQEYKYGFVTDIEMDAFPKGLNETIVRMISAKKKEPEFMTEWRLKAYRHWLKQTEPTWPKANHAHLSYFLSHSFLQAFLQKISPKRFLSLAQGNTLHQHPQCCIRF